MIVIFPMLISQAVSENAIPAIAKTAELYLVGTQVHDIINNPEVKKHAKIKNQSYKIVGKKIISRESVNLTEDFEEDMKDESGTKEKEEKGTKDFEDRMERQRQKEKEEEEREIARAKEKREKHKALEDRIELLKQKAKEEKEEKRQKAKEEKEEKRQKAKEEKEERERKGQAAKEQAAKEKQLAYDEKKEERETAKQAIEDEKRAAAKSSVNIKMVDSKTISLEPTFIPVEHIDKLGNVSKTMIGIKVLPLRVKSDARLSALILNDVKMKNLNAMITTIGRNILRVIHTSVNKWFYRIVKHIPTLGAGTVSGDPRTDILMNKTGQKGQGFIVLSKNEDINDLFISSFKQINRLFKMGWGNIIIADDINRTAYFCMKDYKGVCNAINYSMMYQNLGQLKVYEDLETAKRQSSSLFKIKKRFTKIIGESVVDQKLIKYSSIDEDK